MIILGGKVISVEQLVNARNEQLKAGYNIVLPIFELMYLWNIIPYIHEEHLNTLLQRITMEMDQYHSTDSDSLGLCLLLRGSVYRSIRRWDLAKSDLNSALSYAKTCKINKHIAPFATYEKAIILQEEEVYYLIYFKIVSKK